MYIDGVLKVQSATNIVAFTTLAHSDFQIAGVPYYSNGLYDDVVTVNRAISEDEIRAIYESNAPVFGETSTFQWRAANNLVWADSEGLWMLDAAGNAVLGASGVNGKGWGGTTLSAGDVLIGNTTKGYAFFDADQSTMNLVMADVSGQFARIDSTNGMTLRITNGGAFDNKSAFSWYVDPGNQVGEAPIYFQAKVPSSSEYQLYNRVTKPAGATSYGRYLLGVAGSDVSANRSDVTFDLIGSDTSGSKAYLLSHYLYLGQPNGTASGNIVELWGQGLGINRTPSASYALDVNGSAHASSFPTSSDNRLKDVKGELIDVLGKLRNIGAYRFTWKPGYEAYSQFLDSAGQPTPQIGFLAQEVEIQFPETISLWQHRGGIELEDARAVDYGRLVPVLVAAINELADQIKALSK
jgi:hypothetical protein